MVIPRKTSSERSRSRVGRGAGGGEYVRTGVVVRSGVSVALMAFELPARVSLSRPAGDVICQSVEPAPADAWSTSRTLLISAFGLNGLLRNAAPATSPTLVASTFSA